MRYPLCICLSGTLSGMPALAADPVLTVHLEGVVHAAGQLHIGAYDNAETFRKEAQASAVRLVPAAAGRVSVPFDALRPGRYAVMAWHDEDGDGEFKRRFGMIPVEGYGLSGNPDKAGPPAFADSAFDLPAAAEQTIRMRY